MLIDLHCHTSTYSPCSGLTPEQLIAAAKAAGLQGVCLTEHDRLWPEEAIRRLAAQHDFLVLRGIEISTELGHVLVYGLRAPRRDMFLAQRLRHYVEKDGAVMFLAHPARHSHAPVAAEVLACLFHSVEVINGGDGPSASGVAQALSQGLSLPGIGGSDAHAAADLGSGATRFLRPVTCEAELVAALKAGLYQAVARW